jgi:hypothetical protein
MIGDRLSSPGMAAKACGGFVQATAWLLALLVRGKPEARQRGQYTYWVWVCENATQGVDPMPVP